jgi:hypothetical protein
MTTEKRVRMVTKSANVVYYTIYLLTIIAVVSIFFITYLDVETWTIDPLSSLGTAISTVYMILLLTAIPGSLLYFHRTTVKIKHEEDEVLMFAKYKKASYIRLWIVGLFLVVGVVLVYLLRSQSMIFTSGIAAIALYFCKPSQTKVVRELDLDVDLYR